MVRTFVIWLNYCLQLQMKAVVLIACLQVTCRPLANWMVKMIRWCQVQYSAGNIVFLSSLRIVRKSGIVTCFVISLLLLLWSTASNNVIYHFCICAVSFWSLDDFWWRESFLFQFDWTRCMAVTSHFPLMGRVISNIVHLLSFEWSKVWTYDLLFLLMCYKTELSGLGMWVSAGDNDIDWIWVSR